MLKNAHGRLLLIRADGGSQIGFGHLMRSIALAEEWLARGGLCVWATNDTRALAAAGTGRDDIQITELDVMAGSRGDANATRQLAEDSRADWVLLDQPVFQPDYFSSAGSRGAGWVIVNDGPLSVSERINAILNPCPQAVAGMYPGRSDACGMYLGLDYALLRLELRVHATARSKRVAPPSRVLITFGGSDPGDFTSQILHAIERGMPDSAAHFRVILGPGYRGFCAANGGRFGKLNVEFVRYTSNMGNHYSWADLVLCGASNTLWEAMHCGLPAAVTPAAANQRLTYDALADCPAVHRFDTPGPDLTDWLSRLFAGDGAEMTWFDGAACSGPRMIDGGGVARVVDRLLAWK